MSNNQVQASLVIPVNYQTIQNLEDISEGNIIEINEVQFAVSEVTNPHKEFVNIEVLRRDCSSIPSQEQVIQRRIYQAKNLKDLEKGNLSEICSETYYSKPFNDCDKGKFEFYSNKLNMLRFQTKQDPF
ncbi:MAG: hypothetical protein WCX73_02780 [Candidatus Pacearchaeota archaeon]|jgi:hypothetical protein